MESLSIYISGLPLDIDEKDLGECEAFKFHHSYLLFLVFLFVWTALLLLTDDALCLRADLLPSLRLERCLAPVVSWISVYFYFTTCETRTEILFSSQGSIKKVKIYVNPDGTKKGDALVTYTRAEAAAMAVVQVWWSENTSSHWFWRHECCSIGIFINIYAQKRSSNLISISICIL